MLIRTRILSPVPHVTRRRALPRRLAVVGALLLVVASVPVGRWYLIRRSLGWQVRRGLQALTDADSAARIRAALDRWESETRPNWAERREELITYLYSEYPLDDLRVRLLLTRVTGADYGERREDWQRWYEARRRLYGGQSPVVPRREAVVLKPRWTAPVGLTTWFTTILPLDGQVYVAALGTGFDDAEDRADGVVRVAGTTGTAELIFTLPTEHRGPHDVIGLAAGDDSLFAACYNGFVYCLDADGRTLWHTHVGDPIVAPPLAVDTNSDGVTDVIVATRGGKVLALSGRQGKTIWVASVARPRVGQAMLGATLSLGNLLGGDDAELLVTMPPGDVAALALRSGRALWQRTLSAGIVAGAVSVAGPSRLGPPAYVGDRAASIWSLVGSGRNLEAVCWQSLGVRSDETLVAGLRTLGIQGAGAERTAVNGAWLLACPTGEYAGRWGAVCALSPEGVQWRLPVGGAIWGTPAVADLNGDGRPEIVVASIEVGPTGQTIGVLLVVSASGHIVQRVPIDAAIECSPVVADVDGDSRLEVLVADQSGRLHCFGTEGYGPVEWGLFGGDSHNTRNAANAYAYGQRVFGYQWTWRP